MRIPTIVILLAALVMGLSALFLISGCAWMDLDGNGKVDPLAYLAASNVTVGWEDDSGAVYNVAVDDLGKQIIGQFIEAKTGYKVELVDSGGFTITDPRGFRIQVKSRE